MNLCMFFEGTGQGVAGKITNVTRLRDLCAADARQKLHLEAGPGTHFGLYLAGKIAGVDWRTTFRSAPQPSFSTTRTVRPQTSGEHSTVFAAIFRESDFTSPAKDFNLVSGDCPQLKFSGRDPNGVGDFGVKIARFCKITRKEPEAMAKKVKANLEFLLVKAEVKGVPEKAVV